MKAALTELEDLNDDQVMELGHFCEALMEANSFNVLVKTFESQIVHHLMSTEAHEKNKREGIYASCLGLRDFLDHMKTIVMQRDKLIAEYEQKAEPSEYDAQPEQEID